MIFSLFRKPVCSVCSAENARSILVIPQVNVRATRKHMCRQHFLQEHERIFLDHPYKMLVTYPILNARFSVYGYYDLSEMKKYAYASEDVALVKRVLKMIPAEKECAYFDRTSSEKALGDGQIQYPSLLPESEVEFLSKKDVYTNIREMFSLYQKDFTDGFTVPYGTEGACLSSLL